MNEQESKDELQLVRDYLSGLSYVLMMHMGNDVLYFEDQLAVYRAVKHAIIEKLT